VSNRKKIDPGRRPAPSRAQGGTADRAENEPDGRLVAKKRYCSASALAGAPRLRLDKEVGRGIDHEIDVAPVDVGSTCCARASRYRLCRDASCCDPAGLRLVERWLKDKLMAESGDPTDTQGGKPGQEAETTPSIVFDSYRSLIDPNLMIFVKKDIVPPFRFKAGGWELVQSSIELGPPLQARVAEKGFFMCRVNEDQAGWTELTDLPAAWSSSG